MAETKYQTTDIPQLYEKVQSKQAFSAKVERRKTLIYRVFSFAERPFFIIFSVKETKKKCITK